MFATVDRRRLAAYDIAWVELSLQRPILTEGGPSGFGEYRNRPDPGNPDGKPHAWLIVRRLDNVDVVRSRWVLVMPTSSKIYGGDYRVELQSADLRLRFSGGTTPPAACEVIGEHWAALPQSYVKAKENYVATVDSPDKRREILECVEFLIEDEVSLFDHEEGQYIPKPGPWTVV